MRRGHIAAVDLVLGCGSHHHSSQGRALVVLERMAVDGFISSDETACLVAEEGGLSSRVERLERLKGRRGMRGKHSLAASPLDL